MILTRPKIDASSCELCKARKVKCDRGQPACSWCSRHNRECVYLDRQRPAVRVKQVMDLEVKVKQLDILLHALGRRLEEHIESDGKANHHQPHPEALQQYSPSVRSQQFATTGSGGLACYAAGDGSRPSRVDQISRRSGGETAGLSTPSAPPAWFTSYGSGGEAPFLSPPGDGREHTNYQFAGSALSIPSLLHNTSPNSPQPLQGARQQVPAAPTTTTPDSPSLMAPTAELPRHDVLYMLVDLYFKHVNTWCPILDRKTTFAAFFGSTSLSEPDRVLAHAIVAVALRFSHDQRLPAQAKAHFHRTSQKRVMEYVVAHVSIDALKAAVVLYLDELGSPSGPRGRNLLALIAQHVSSLGLGQERDVYLKFVEVSDEFDAPSAAFGQVALQQPDSWIDDEGRRRLFWAAYMLDQYSAIARIPSSFLVSDTLANRFLPCSYDLFSKNKPVETRRPLWPRCRQQALPIAAAGRPENLGSFSYHCEILHIISSIHKFVLKCPRPDSTASSLAVNDEWQATYQSLDRALDEWLHSLPGEYGNISGLCHSDPASRVANWFMLHSAFVTAVVRLHSVAAYSFHPTTAADEGTSLPPFTHYAVQRCLSAVHSLADMARDIIDADGLNLLGPPFTLSLWVAVRVLILHAAAFETDVDPVIDFLTETLRTMAQYWKIAGVHAEIADRVVRKGRQGEVGFRDMRKYVYHMNTSSTAQHKPEC